MFQLMTNLEKLKEYFDQARLEYILWSDDDIRIDFNYWVYYIHEDKTLDIGLIPSVCEDYNGLDNKSKKEFIECMNGKFNIEIEKVNAIDHYKNRERKSITLEEFKKSNTISYQPWVYDSSFNIVWEYVYENGEYFKISYNSYYKRLYAFHSNSNNLKVLIDEEEFIGYLTKKYNVKIDDVFYWC